jgi:hypothetical protein
MIARSLKRNRAAPQLHPRKMEELRARVDWINAKEGASKPNRPGAPALFLFRCLHKARTKLPEGSRAPKASAAFSRAADAKRVPDDRTTGAAWTVRSRPR